jgi:hypothetical protein
MATEGTQVPPEAQDTESLRAALAEREAQIAAANDRLGRMEETLNALRPPPPGPQQPPPGKRFVIPANIRNQIAALGVNDREIETNGDLIVPFIQAYLGQAASEVVAMIQQQADDIAQLHMLRDESAYPHADTLFNEVTKVRRAEAQAGRYINPETAYRIAVANNLDRVAASGGDTAGGTPGGQFNARSSTPAPAAPSPVAVRSRDVSTGSSFRTVRGPVTAPEKPAQTSDDLLSMSREERKTFFDQNKETPIR